MKKIIYTILLIACFSQAWSQKSYLQNIEISDKHIKKEQGKIEITLDIDLSQMRIHQQHSVKLIPVIIAKNNSKSKELPAIIINGKTRTLVHQRIERLTRQPYPYDAKTVINRHNKTMQTVTYTTHIPYEKWMSSSTLVLREKISGCAECAASGYKQNEEMPLLSDCFPIISPNYILTFKEPATEPIKTREDHKEARLQFRQDNQDILPKYKHNQKELDTIKQSIVNVQNKNSITIQGIYITGYASPEGTQTHNMRLSQARAEALARYLYKELSVEPEIMHVHGKGEDWEGLRLEVEKRPKLLYQDKVLAIIDNCTAPDESEETFKQLDPDGEIYKRLLNECYPPLRRNKYRIVYNVQNFNLEEAKQIIKSNPKLLSLNEMYLVAESYKDTPGTWEEIINIAARTFPENGIAASNAAQIEMNKGNILAAIHRLEKVKDDPDSWEHLGVAYAKNGDLELAQKYLSKAAKQGNTQAQKNLEKLEQYISEL